MAARLKIGELLIDAGVLSAEQLDQALGLQKTEGARLGDLLVRHGVVTETHLTQALSRQLSVPWVSLWHIDFSRSLLNLVPQMLADRYCLIPIYVRHVRTQGDTLYVAMDDPTNEEALRFVAGAAGLPVKPMIAAPTDIRAAIRAYYMGEPLPENLPKGRPGSRPPPPPSHPAPAAAAAPVPAKPMPAPLPPKQADLDARPRKRTIALTLLDGTTIEIPSAGPGSRGAAAATQDRTDGVPTASDIVAALRAIAGGADPRQILPGVRLESVLATVMALLLQKHLIADWEFVDEMRNHR